MAGSGPTPDLWEPSLLGMETETDRHPLTVSFGLGITFETPGTIVVESIKVSYDTASVMLMRKGYIDPKHLRCAPLSSFGDDFQIAPGIQVDGRRLTCHSCLY